MASVAQLVELRIVAPAVASSHLVVRPRFGLEQALVAQLDRAVDFESKGRRFESFQAYQNFDRRARVAELADAPDLGSGILRCRGSSPLSRTNCVCPVESPNKIS